MSRIEKPQTASANGLTDVDGAYPAESNGQAMVPNEINRIVRYDLSRLNKAGHRVTQVQIVDGQLVVEIAEPDGPTIPMFNEQFADDMRKLFGQEVAGEILDRAYDVVMQAKFLKLLES